MTSDPGPYTLHHGDARNLVDEVARVGLGPEPFITSTITSPPYGSLKNYGGKEQVGWGQDYDEYLADCGDVFQQIFDLTKPDGTLWLIADTVRPESPQPPRRLQALPFQLADQAEKAGWILRDVIIWRKDRTLPWNTSGRLRNVFEYVLLLVKSASFPFHIDRLREPTEAREWWVRFPERYNPLGVAPPNVWDIGIPKQGSWGQDVARHACPLPDQLVDRLILLTSDPGDVILDPFAGTGTVLTRAHYLGRVGVGLDSNPDYVDTFVREDRRADVVQGADRHRASATKIRQLRALKYARVLYESSFPFGSVERAMVVGAVVQANINDSDDISNPRSVVSAKVTFVAGDEVPVSSIEELRTRIVAAAGKKPASKFGVQSSLAVVAACEVAAATKRKRLFVYPNGRFWCHDGGLRDVQQTLANADRSGKPRLLILSNIALHESAAIVEVGSKG